MLVTTTPSIEGRKPQRYSAALWRAKPSSARTCSKTCSPVSAISSAVARRQYERELQRARDMAINEMTEKAAALGGNAVVGVDLDYEVLGQGNGMLMVSASGTAVVVE